MLKFDRLGPGANVVANNSKVYSNLLDEVTDFNASLDLGTPKGAGCAHVRYVGTGRVAEGHCAVNVATDTSITVATSTLTLNARVIERDIPEGATSVDLSDEFIGLTSAKVEAVGATLADSNSVNAAGNVVTLAAAAPKGAKLRLKDVAVATGTATTDNNAATVNLDSGDYQVHFVACAHDTAEDTRMPNPTMMEFVKHCRPLNIRW